MEKKTKLTISGIAKKSIKNIEIAKTQGKNSVVIEKQSNKFLSRGGSVKPGGFKPKTTSTFNRGAPIKPSFPSKSPPITNDFERRKLAEQRATKRLKGENDSKDKKTLKAGTKKRELKLTVSRALSDEIEARARSEASVKRARQKENKNLTKEEASSFVKFLFSFCLALLTEASLLALASISSLKALETVNFNSLFFVPAFKVFLSLLSFSPLSLLVALCSASLRLSKSFVIGGDLDGNDGLIGAPLLNVEVVLGLKPPGLTDPPRLRNLFDCFSITTEFFP